MSQDQAQGLLAVAPVERVDQVGVQAVALVELGARPFLPIGDSS
ncbi:hypothetical protein [Nonomuraea africana]|uniref:Uncharacterized protein n=1 Tax=Nonomuraea africana TaxID=46171 RepID=A0ABR9KGQ1_9ACTN|nr:hypothetical protein [Nonomuraea africana]